MTNQITTVMSAFQPFIAFLSASVILGFRAQTFSLWLSTDANEWNGALARTTRISMTRPWTFVLATFWNHLWHYVLIDGCKYYSYFIQTRRHIWLEFIQTSDRDIRNKSFFISLIVNNQSSTSRGFTVTVGSATKSCKKYLVILVDVLKTIISFSLINNLFRKSGRNFPSNFPHRLPQDQVLSEHLRVEGGELPQWHVTFTIWIKEDR